MQPARYTVTTRGNVTHVHRVSSNNFPIAKLVYHRQDGEDRRPLEEKAKKPKQTKGRNRKKGR